LYTVFQLKSQNFIEIIFQALLIHRNLSFFYSMSSSSQDEIIEISSSPSSLDNDSLESSQTTPGQNVPSMSSPSSSNSILEKRSLFKSDKRNQPKFKKEWL